MPTHETPHDPRPTVGRGPAPRGHAAAVVGLQWGDEGKGKVIDLLAGSFSAVVRYNGGANAGHSVVINGRRHALHLIPSGAFHPGVKCVIANGVVVDPEALIHEIDGLAAIGAPPIDLALSDRAHVVMPWHKAEDEARERALASDRADDRSIGTTRRGIGPAYADKAHRSTAIRIGDLLRPGSLAERIGRAAAVKQPMLAALDPAAAAAPTDPARLRDLTAAAAAAGQRLRPHITDTTYLLHDMLRQGRNLLFEGANATLLDLDHGTFPYVTSSNCSVLGIGPGSGVPGAAVTRVIGVMKAYCTRVGAGPFPTELLDETAARIRERGREYGTTTGRPRRCGWLDLVALRYAVMLNGVTSIALMLLDVLAGFDELRVCTAYNIDGSPTDRFLPDAEALARARPVWKTMPGFAAEIGHIREPADLPPRARDYIELIQDHAGAPVEIISVGPDREQTIRA